MTPTISSAQRTAWLNRATAQGLFCFICRQVPAFENRHQFYGTGLCGACLKELHVHDPEHPVG